MTIAPPTAIAELRHWPRWVAWRTVERNGKATKVPFRPSGRPASSTDPGTWSDHAECLSVAERGLYEGVGYVFAPDDEYAGIDLDHCVINGKISFGARAIIDRLSSYTELSPSGTGVHIIVRASINGGRNRTKKTPWGGDFESYDRGRFFTVTGKHLAGTPETIEARQEELDAIRAELFPPDPKANGVATSILAPAPVTLDDVALEEKIRSSKQGPKFVELFDRGAGEGGESEADLGLCNILAFWLGPDPARIDEWFRRSALMREKWDDKRGETTYGGYTIARALEGRTDFYGQKTSPRLVPTSFEGRAEAVAESRVRAAELLGLDDRTVTGGRSWGEDLEARVEIDISDGTTLVFKTLSTYTAPAKINALISFQIGGASALTQATIYELFRHLRLICDFHEAVTIEGRARDCGITFLHTAQTLPARMVDDQAERWNAMAALAAIDPVERARAGGKSVATECVVINSNGTRYVRTAWFAAYAREYAGSSATAEQIVGRMVALGWRQAGSEGRVKATQPGTKKTLNWSFFTVPEGWENR